MRTYFKILSVLTLIVIVFSCKPDPEPPIVIIVPDPVPTEHNIDQFYYVQFTWGKGTDTITMQEPRDTAAYSKDTNSFLQISEEILSEPMVNPIGVDEDTDVEDLDTIGWVYAPTAWMFPYNYIQYMRGLSQYEFNQVNRNVFRISFSYVQLGDTVPFWDIQDYLDNPSVKEGSIPWGRVGNNIPTDTIWNFDARDGVTISYIDKNGELWKSDSKPAFQPEGSFFQIDSLYVNHHDFITYNIMVGRFSARLYNSVGYSKDVRNGKFKMKIFTDINLGPKPE